MRERLVIPPELAHLSPGAIAKALGYSRTAILQARRREAGLCISCAGRDPDQGGYCASCRRSIRKSQARRARKKNGFRKWKPGSRGRPPKAAK